jgi:RNA polymerase sigma-70 factor (ECF subfamily)
MSVHNEAAVQQAAMSPDEALVRSARLGDAAAFESLVAKRIDRSYRLAWSILLNDADAADATQDAFIAAWRQLPRLRDPSRFDGWLNRIVANTARMSRRHRVRLREIAIESPSADDSPTAAYDQAPDRLAHTVIDDVAENDAIGRSFDRLRPDERAILALHYVEERPVAEIARALGIPTGTAKWRLHAARRALERAMEAEA